MNYWISIEIHFYISCSEIRYWVSRIDFETKFQFICPEWKHHLESMIQASLEIWQGPHYNVQIQIEWERKSEENWELSVTLVCDICLSQVSSSCSRPFARFFIMLFDGSRIRRPSVPVSWPCYTRRRRRRVFYTHSGGNDSENFVQNSIRVNARISDVMRLFINIYICHKIKYRIRRYKLHKMRVCVIQHA